MPEAGQREGLWVTSAPTARVPSITNSLEVQVLYPAFRNGAFAVKHGSEQLDYAGYWRTMQNKDSINYLVFTVGWMDISGL